MIDEVDEDKSGTIEFPEFLHIIMGKTGNEKSKMIYYFFKSNFRRINW